MIYLKRTRETRQKKIIEDAVKHFTSFFNAEELHQYIAKKGVGIATIYRLLTILVSEGKIHSFQCNRRTIYSSNKKNHCHFVCERCGERKHIQPKKLDFLEKEIEGKVCHVQIDISGICEKCGKKD